MKRITSYILTALTLILPLTVMLSCSTPKSITYFQDAEYLNGMAVQAEQHFTLRPGDKINIVVNSSNPMLSQQFSLTSSTQGNYTLGASVTPQSTAGKNSAVGQMIAYTVDEQGTINFPVLGKISVGGKTRTQVADYIQDRLVARELVEDPIVTVEYVNLGINILGEVNRPGHIDILKDKFSITDALAAAGDLTINGERKNILVTRQEDGVNHIYTIDLTNMQSMLQSEVYYLQQNDLIYVAPNEKRMRESRAVGNTLNTPGFWISLTSLAATVVTLVNSLSK